jgi:hypothetical protein
MVWLQAVLGRLGPVLTAPPAAAKATAAAATTFASLVLSFRDTTASLCGLFLRARHRPLWCRDHAAPKQAGTQAEAHQPSVEKVTDSPA